MKELEESGIFNYLNKAFVFNIASEHYSNKKNNTYKLYQLLHLSKWILNYK